jgi:hypothetical protein
MEWKLINVHYDTNAKRISVLDSDSDTLKCLLNAKNDMLLGAVHLQNNTKDPLNFVRADKNLEFRLCYPRIPDINEKISYTYKKP